MRTRQYHPPLPNDPPAVSTSRLTYQLCIAAGAVVVAITLAACGSDNNTRRGTDPQLTPAAEITREAHMTSPSDTVQLPDLTDPATRAAPTRPPARPQTQRARRRAAHQYASGIDGSSVLCFVAVVKLAQAAKGLQR